MKYALVNGIKKEAERNELGECRCCGSKVRAYCGLEKINHWKHINLIECDTWSEGETEWHRQWKNIFDKSQQEVIKHDEITGEKHIADVYISSKDLVIEFQHSPIHFNEIKARELFYKKMIWIIDVSPYSKNILFHKDIGSKMYHIVLKPEAQHTESKCRILEKEGKYEMAKELINESWNNSNLFEASIEKYIKDSETNDYYLMEWKHEHKRWKEVSLPIFFDIGDGFIYRSVYPITYWKGFIVKRYEKEFFIAHYKK